MQKLAGTSLVVLTLLLGAAPPASPEHSGPGTSITRYDLFASYPNARRMRGYFLRGVNQYSTTISVLGPQGTNLWFEPLGGGAFKQFNTFPYRDCHWDLLRWAPGRQGPLVYLETHADCFAVHTTVVFHPGIAYMPRTWQAGERWSQRGVSGTSYSEDGVAVCAGTNTWRSRVAGVTTMPNGEAAIHTQTLETQLLAPVAGAPGSAACPAGGTKFEWEENFYVAADGLVRSTGGNTAATRQAGHPQWDSVYSGWNPLPPADVGLLTTPTAGVGAGSTGNTVTFSYRAPSGGVQDASLAIAVPPGWTPPVTADAPGCTTATAGTVIAGNQAITVSALTLPPFGQAVISYGAVSGGTCTAGDGATAPSANGAPVWQGQVSLTPGGAPANLRAPPAIRVSG